MLDAAAGDEPRKAARRSAPARCRSSSARRCAGAARARRPAAAAACSSPTAATRRPGSGRRDIIYIGEGWNASVAVSRLPNGVLQLSQRRQGAGVERAAGHAAAAHARPPHDAGPDEPEARCWSSAAAPASPPARSRSIRRSSTQTIAEIEPLVPQVVSTLLRRAQLRRRHATRRSRSHLDDARHYPADDEREVRRDHLGPARPVGEGRGDALHARVLRAGQGAPQSRRRRDAVRAAVREQHRRR